MLNRLCILISYAYIGRTTQPFVEALSPYINILLDSGAFTYRRRKKYAIIHGKEFIEPGVPEYIQYLKGSGHYYSHYIARDVIGDSVETMANLGRMLDAGLLPVPVLTVVMPSDQGVKFVEEVNPYICVAGGVDEKQYWLSGRISRIYRDTGGRARPHCLGYGRYPGILTIRGLYSCDSSSGFTGSLFGNYRVFRYIEGFPYVWWKLMGKEKYSNFIAAGMDRSRIDVDKERRHEYPTGQAAPLIVLGLRSSLDFSYAVNHLRQVHYYTACTGQFPQLCCAASGASRGIFDYPLYAERYHTWQAYRKAKQYSRAMDYLIDIVKEETRWQEKPC